MGIQRQFDCRAKLIRHDANASGRQGVFTKDDALWAVKEAADSCANMNLPEVYAHGIAGNFARLQSNFETAF